MVCGRRDQNAGYFNGRIDTDRGFVSNIYKNFLGKDYADDPAGIESWVRHLEAGHSRGETLVKLFEVAQTPEAIAAAPVAAAIFRNKTAVSAYMAEKIADIAQRDDGTYDYEPFQAIIRGTTDTNLEEQKAKVDQLASGQTPSTNKNLTAETDNIVGTDGDDTFSGVYYVGNGTRTSTLSSLDTLDGKAGKDTLNLTVQKNGGGSDSVDMSAIEGAMRGVSNIENLNIRSEVAFSGSADINRGLDNLNIQTIGAVTISTDTKEKVSIDTTKQVQLTANEAKEVTVKAGTPTPDTELSYVKAAKATKASINLTNKANTLASSSVLTEVADLTLANLTLDASLTVAKAAKISLKDVKFGTSDNKNISTDAENVELSMTYTGDNIGKVNLTASAADKVKTLSINAKAQKSATLTIDNAKINSLTKVTVKGDAKDLTLDLSAQNALKDIDASAFTGNFAELYVKNTENSTFKLGSGDDVVKLNLSTTLTDQKKQTIDGGAGTDLLMIDATIAAGGKIDDVTINNFEGLKISGQIGATAIDMAKWAGFSHITLVGGSSASVTSANATFNNLLNNSTITLEGKKADHDIALNIKDAATGTNDTVNIVLDPKTFTVSGSDKIGLNNGGNFVIDDIENVNITSNLDTEKTEGVKNTVKFNATADAKGVLTNATIKGDADTEVIFGSNIKKIKALDASALEGKFTFDSTAHLADKAVIKGGAKDDTITFASTMATTVTGGAGKDTFVINKGIDPVTFAASKTSTITDFTKGDIIKIGGSAPAVTQDKIVKSETSGSLDFANNFKEALKAAGNQKVAYFTYRDPDSNSTDTYVVKSNGADAVADPNDYVVKLSGAVDLSNATITTSGNDTLITL